MREIKCCVYCEHFNYDKGHVWSTLTEDPQDLSCRKGHWDNPDHLKEFRGYAAIAKDCPDYLLSSDVND